MKHALCLSLILSANTGTLLAAPAEDLLPQPAAGDRYLKMADRSPFAPPSVGPAAVPIATPPPPGPKWSDQLSVALVTQQGGTYFATIYDKGKNEHFLLQSDRVDAERQLPVASVQWGDLTDQTIVNLRHNDDTAAVHFDSSASTAVTTAAPMPIRSLGGPTLPPGVAGLPRFTPPPPPPNMPGNVPSSNVQRRQAPIRTTPTVTNPAIRPPPNPPRRPVATREDDEE